MKKLNELLSVRELETVRLLRDGLHNKEIGLYMGIEENTVKHHLVHACDKAGCENRVALAVRYERENPLK